MTDRLVRAAESNTVTLAQFRAKVAKHLAAAQSALAGLSAVPLDAMDDELDPLLKQLQAIDHFVFGLGYDQRAQERIEDKRESQLAAKRSNPDVERCVMRIDHAVQNTLEILGRDESMQRVLAPMDAVQLISAVVDLLDAYPPEAFTPTRIMPPGFRDEYDATVRGIIKLMHTRKSQ